MKNQTLNQIDGINKVSTMLDFDEDNDDASRDYVDEVSVSSGISSSEEEEEEEELEENNKSHSGDSSPSYNSNSMSPRSLEIRNYARNLLLRQSTHNNNDNDDGSKVKRRLLSDNSNAGGGGGGEKEGVGVVDKVGRCGKEVVDKEGGSGKEVVDNVEVEKEVGGSVNGSDGGNKIEPSSSSTNQSSLQHAIMKKENTQTTSSTNTSAVLTKKTSTTTARLQNGKSSLQLHSKKSKQCITGGGKKGTLRKPLSSMNTNSNQSSTINNKLNMKSNSNVSKSRRMSSGSASSSRPKSAPAGSNRQPLSSDLSSLYNKLNSKTTNGSSRMTKGINNKKTKNKSNHSTQVAAEDWPGDFPSNQTQQKKKKEPMVNAYYKLHSTPPSTTQHNTTTTNSDIATELERDIQEIQLYTKAIVNDIGSKASSAVSAVGNGVEAISSGTANVFWQLWEGEGEWGS